MKVMEKFGIGSNWQGRFWRYYEYEKKGRYKMSEIEKNIKCAKIQVMVMVGVLAAIVGWIWIGVG